MNDEKHGSEEVNQALIKLAGALCSWERSTGRRSILILKEEGEFRYRLDSGKPTAEDIPDDELLKIVT